MAVVQPLLQGSSLHQAQYLLHQFFMEVELGPRKKGKFFNFITVIDQVNKEYQQVLHRFAQHLSEVRARYHPSLLIVKVLLVRVIIKTLDLLSRTIEAPFITRQTQFQTKTRQFSQMKIWYRSRNRMKYIRQNRN